MSTKALIGVLLAGTVGILIFLFVHLSGTSNKITIGATQASACDTKHGEDCLPDVKYVDTSGKAYTLADLKDKVVLVNFWATWCHPCQQEIPALSKLYDQYKSKGVLILGVLADNNVADAELLNFQSDHEMSFPIVRGNSDLMVAFSYPQALPTTFVYDRMHRMVGRPHVGAISPAELSAQLEELVAQK
jgi:thiol-disulfide isomerase/thioredoxin